MKKILLSLFVFLIPYFVFSQDEDKKIIPTGWKFGGALPALSYDTDVGLRYGAIAYIYDWGDGSLYPDYLRSIYLETSWTTKGSNIYRINYDDKAFLGSNVRFLGELGYYVDKALDFYGFNGYQAVYNHQWEVTGTDDYRSRMYYRHERKMFRLSTDFQIPLQDNKIRLFAGANLFSVKINSVDIDKLNEGKTDPNLLLPSVDSVPGIYELYQQWKILPENEIHGGNVALAKVGIIYDTRDNEAMPTKGLWDEAIIIGGVPFGSSPYLQMVITHRQYFTLVKKHLFFAYRIVYNQVLAGHSPYYMLPFYFNTKEIQNGFGGAKTVRGILRNRIVADGLAFENAELRWRVVDFTWLKQNFYVALSAFVDGAMVVKNYEFNQNNIPASVLDGDEYFRFSAEPLKKFHMGYGGGFRIAMNENFIVAVDMGFANDEQDGSSGMYIGLGWLF